MRPPCSDPLRACGSARMRAHARHARPMRPHALPLIPPYLQTPDSYTGHTFAKFLITIVSGLLTGVFAVGLSFIVHNMFEWKNAHIQVRRGREVGSCCPAASAMAHTVPTHKHMLPTTYHTHAHTQHNLSPPGDAG